MAERQARRAAPPDKVIAYLGRRGGSMASAYGRGVTAQIARAIRCENVNNVHITLRALEAQGLITREVRGKRTFRISLADHDAAALSATRARHTPRRQRIFDYLSAAGGSVESAEGMGLRPAMAKAVGYNDVRVLNAMLRQLEREGLIVVESGGGRTWRIALAEPPRRSSRSRRPS